MRSAGAMYQWGGYGQRLSRRPIDSLAVMESIGELIFYVALIAFAVTAATYLALLLRVIVITIRRGDARRPALVNYAGLAVGLAIPLMIVGLVLWGRLPWWSVLLFAPLVAMRVVSFKMGQSITRRKE